MYVIWGILGTLLVRTARYCLYVRPVYTLVRRRFFCCRLAVARLFGTSLSMLFIRRGVTFD